LNKIEVKKTPLEAKEIAYVGHSINQISKLILHNSNNFASEIVARVAAAKYFNFQKEVDENDVSNMIYSIFSPYYSTKDVVADASGVSRKNKLCSKTIGNILSKVLTNEEFKKLLATSNQGTLSQRMLFLKDNLRAKTGTLREYSSLCACFTTRNNNDVILVSIVQGSSKRKALLKDYENKLVGLIYKKY
jgi:D-alanyl-D-alanine carboxypeptidase